MSPAAQPQFKRNLVAITENGDVVRRVSDDGASQRPDRRGRRIGGPDAEPLRVGETREEAEVCFSKVNEPSGNAR